jgi:copper(I)-binding protein
MIGASAVLMRLRTVIELLAALILTFAAIAAISQMAKASGIRVDGAYARASLGAGGAGAIYLTLRNEGSDPDRLRSASADVAGRAELHRHEMRHQVMSMRKVACLVVPAGGTVELAPGGMHVMLLDMRSPLVEGSQLLLRLVFDRAGEISVQVPVKSSIAAENANAGQKLELCD